MHENQPGARDLLTEIEFKGGGQENCEMRTSSKVLRYSICMAPKINNCFYIYKTVQCEKSKLLTVNWFVL